MSGTNGAHSAHPPATVRVEVMGKPGFEDAAGAAVRGQFAHLGLPPPTEVRVCALYEITGRLTLREAELAARELLADPVTQNYRIGDSATLPGFLIGPHWRVEVWLKPSVSDPAEASVRKGVADLGLPMPERVRCGTAYKIAGRLTATQIEKASRKILSNPVIHRVSLVAP